MPTMNTNHGLTKINHLVASYKVWNGINAVVCNEFPSGNSYFRMETDRYSNLAVCKKPLNKGFFALANAGSRKCSSGIIYFRMSTKYHGSMNR